MYAGRVVEKAPRTSSSRGRAPYTRGCCRSASPRGHRERLLPIAGQPPDLADLPAGCASLRVAHAVEACRQHARRSRASRPAHQVACILAELHRCPSRCCGSRSEGHFPVMRGVLFRGQVARCAPWTAVASTSPRRDPRPRRRKRLRQDDHRRPSCACSSPAPAGPLRRRGHHAPRQAAMRRLRQRMQIIFQDPYGSLDPRMTVRDISRAAADPRLAEDRAATRRRVAELAATSSACARHGRPLSARVLRRPAPAHRHRPRTRPGAAPHRLRRAGLRARRLDPGPDRST